MSIKAVLFDLDGTLLPMDNEELVRNYFSRIQAYMADYGYDKDVFAKALFVGLGAMMKNDGCKNNESVFWDAFSSVAGPVSGLQYSAFESFYESEFDKVKEVCGYEPLAPQVIKLLRSRGIKVAIATQPAFPRVATEKRIAWAGIDTADIELFTTFENSHFCKPDVRYYEEIANKLGVLPEECLMVGNDTVEDMAAKEIGMSVFLLTDNLINKNNADISQFANGGFADLIGLLDKI